MAKTDYDSGEAIPETEKEQLELLQKILIKVQSLCEAPHWDSDRRWKIQRHTMDAIEVIKKLSSLKEKGGD